MVEYECNDPWGHTKIIRLYGGASWIEVLLNEPALVYWDFDNPKNFAADGPTPGQWLFSDGQSGPVGREAAAGTDIAMNAEILTYARSKGVFAGISLNGAVVHAVHVDDRALYGDADRRQILEGRVPEPAEAQPLIRELDEYSRA